jgi:D-3-phosphoglycerate dehydrogenase
MSTEPLVLDLVEWVAARPRPYAEVIDAWRTSCPRLTVWEEACDRALIACAPAADGTLTVAATEAGRRAVAARLSPGPPPSPSR